MYFTRIRNLIAHIVGSFFDRVANEFTFGLKESYT